MILFIFCNFQQVPGGRQTEYVHLGALEKMPEIPEKSARIYIAAAKLEQDDVDLVPGDHVSGACHGVQFMPFYIQF